jgi:hypothetical protein
MAARARISTATPEQWPAVGTAGDASRNKASASRRPGGGISAAEDRQRRMANGSTGARQPRWLSMTSSNGSWRSNRSAGKRGAVAGQVLQDRNGFRSLQGCVRQGSTGEERLLIIGLPKRQRPHLLSGSASSSYFAATVHDAGIAWDGATTNRPVPASARARSNHMLCDGATRVRRSGGQLGDGDPAVT